MSLRSVDNLLLEYLPIGALLPTEALGTVDDPASEDASRSCWLGVLASGVPSRGARRAQAL